MPSTHRDYIIDRNAKIESLFSDLAANAGLKTQFVTDPTAVAKSRGLVLTSEEAAAVSTFGNTVNLQNLKERLTYSQMAAFDANCKC